MNLKKMQEFFSTTPKIIYPFEAIETVGTIPIQKVFPITTSINGYTIAGLMISFDTKLFDEYGIGYPPPTPNLNFRMVDLRKRSYVIEIVLDFGDGKIMRLHLNPFHQLVRHYLKKGLKNKIVAFHFYNQNDNNLIDSITNLDEDELDWFQRNLKLAKKLKSNKYYELLSDAIEEQTDRGSFDKWFKFYNQANQNVLVAKSEKFFKSGNVKYFFSEPDEK